MDNNNPFIPSGSSQPNFNDPNNLNIPNSPNTLNNPNGSTAANNLNNSDNFNNPTNINNPANFNSNAASPINSFNNFNNQATPPSPNLAAQSPQPFSEESYFESHPNQSAAFGAGALAGSPGPIPSGPSSAITSPSGAFHPTAPLVAAKSPTTWSTFQIIITIILSAPAVLFIALFIWMFVMWRSASDDVQGQIDLAQAEAIKDTTAKLEADFTEREKYPYKTFVGPTDYGELSFEYPKTWSLYVASDASDGDYLAYLNPDSVVGTDSINALEVQILNQSIDQVSQYYQSSLTNGEVEVSVRPINGQNATIYTGDISNNIRGIAALFKIRDKTAIVQTDAMIFSDAFYRVLDTIKFNS